MHYNISQLERSCILFRSVAFIATDKKNTASLCKLSYKSKFKVIYLHRVLQCE